MAKEKKITQCESCAYFDYDEEYDCYLCTINVDEDDYASFMGGGSSCPYYHYYDEYSVVRKQN